MSDRYATFDALRSAHEEGRDFRVEWRLGVSGIAVMAPHGGGIEPGTSEVARVLAGLRHSFYHFEGLMRNGNGALHLTSTRFDEPRALALAERAEWIVTVHGCAGDPPVIHLGGLHEAWKLELARKLEVHGFAAASHLDYRGLDPENLCNRGKNGSGVQLELTLGLRRALFPALTRTGRLNTTPLFHRLIDAFRTILTRSP